MYLITYFYIYQIIIFAIFLTLCKHYHIFSPKILSSNQNVS